MPDTIRDGHGSGNLAHVNNDGQLETRSIGVEQRLKSTIDENYYEATTGQVTLTDANETGIIYLKNTSTTQVMVIDRVFWDIWATTGGSGPGTLKYYKDVTYTGGTSITPNNTNYGSVAAATGTFLKSLTTISGTVWWTANISDDSSIALEEGRIILANNSTHGISVTAPTGNTSMVLSINVAFYYFETELV